MGRQWEDDDFNAGEALVALSAGALAVLRQLAERVRWDGDVDSKRGRDELVSAGLAWHAWGYQGLTAWGCRVAIADGVLRG